jgi:aerobic-type carbon monoxide dehydrogenase small subunit (CoxS/CutS family)
VKHPVTLTVNGVDHPLEVEADRSLLRALRDDIGLTGTKEGCDDSECGACMVLVAGRPVNSCSYLALQAADREITTVEGLAGADGGLHPLQRTFLERGGVQCGYCTPGMLMSAKALLDASPSPTETEVRQALGGNLCRCTGYSKIVQAVLAAASVGSDRSPAASLASGEGS